MLPPLAWIAGQASPGEKGRSGLGWLTRVREVTALWRWERVVGGVSCVGYAPAPRRPSAHFVQFRVGACSMPGPTRLTGFSCRTASCGAVSAVLTPSRKWWGYPSSAHCAPHRLRLGSASPGCEVALCRRRVSGRPLGSQASCVRPSSPRRRGREALRHLQSACTYACNLSSPQRDTPMAIQRRPYSVPGFTRFHQLPLLRLLSVSSS